MTRLPVNTYPLTVQARREFEVQVTDEEVHVDPVWMGRAEDAIQKVEGRGVPRVHHHHAPVGHGRDFLRARMALPMTCNGWPPLHAPVEPRSHDQLGALSLLPTDDTTASSSSTGAT